MTKTDNKNIKVISFGEIQRKTAPLERSDLPPLVRRLVDYYGIEFVRDLQRAYHYAERDMLTSQIKPDPIRIAPFRMCFPRPDATTVAFLDPVNAQLYCQSTAHPSGHAYYYLVTNSGDLLSDDRQNLLRFLLGGIFVYDRSLAKRWQYLLSE